MLAARRVLRGISFGILELMIAQGWAEFHGLRMAVELDHATDTEEYEEVLAFYRGAEQLRRFLIWHDRRELVVQPLIGRPRRFTMICDALDSIIISRP
jgi:hypothetical protein